VVNFEGALGACMGRVIKRREDLPIAFDLTKYDFLRGLDAAEWSAILGARLRVRDDLYYRDYLLSIPESQQFPEHAELLNNAEKDCIELSQVCIDAPNLGEIERANNEAQRFRQSPENLKFGVVKSLTVGMTYSVGRSLKRLPLVYRNAIAKAGRNSSSLSPDEKKAINTPLSIARQEIDNHLPQWRALVVDMEATDTAIVEAFGVWLRSVRQRDTYISSGKEPSDQARRWWVKHRIVQYCDLTQWARARDSRISWPLLARILFPDIDVSEDKLRKTTKARADEWLTERTFAHLARQAEKTGMTSIAEESESGKFPE
jgi:hypothetical protein